MEDPGNKTVADVSRWVRLQVLVGPEKCELCDRYRCVLGITVIIYTRAQAMLLSLSSGRAKASSRRSCWKVMSSGK